MGGTEIVKRRQLLLSVLISIGISLLPMVFRTTPFLLALAMPGRLVAALVSGQHVQRIPQSVLVVTNVIIWSMGLYFGSASWRWKSVDQSKGTLLAVKALFIFWIVLLLPWFVFAPLSAMAFDGGPTAEAYTLVWSIWTYPVSLGIAAAFRKRTPWIVFLPILNIAGIFSSELLHKSP